MADRATLNPRRTIERTELRCRQCGYQIVVNGKPPSCPMCRGWEWERLREQLRADPGLETEADEAREAVVQARPTWDNVDALLVEFAGSGAAIRGAASARTFRIAKYAAGWRILLETETTSRWVLLADLRQCWETFERLGRIGRADVLEPARCSAFVMALFRSVPGVRDPAGDARSLLLP